MSVPDNDRGPQLILNYLLAASVVVLLLHFYFYCYSLFAGWGLRSSVTDRILVNLVKTGLFNSLNVSKCWSIGLLAIFLAGGKGKKNHQLRLVTPLVLLTGGLILYFGANFLTDLTAVSPVIHIGICLSGYCLILAGGSLLSRILKTRIRKDIFNTANESFPQQEQLVQNDESINLPIRYSLNGRERKGFINIVNPFRGLLVMGSPGSGKSWFVIRQVIRQHIRKGYSMFVYDFKYDDLTKLAYNCYLTDSKHYRVPPKFYNISFDDLARSHRCNPLDPSTLSEIADAAESARTILFGLNKDWIEKQGDFWVESSISFLTALIWYLRKYKNGKYCTLPHVIELLQVEFGKLFSILRAEPEIRNHISPFLSAYMNNVMETLDNQVSSLKIAISRLSSPSLYYIMSGNDLSLDINNPAASKILCLGNNPQRSGIYGAAISLYITAINRTVNRSGKLKSSHVYDELPTVRIHLLNELLATARSNKVAVTLCVQELSQLRMNYGRNQADVIMNLPANIISGQVSGDSAKMLSERIGKIIQERQSIQVNRQDTSYSTSSQLDMAVPMAKIARLSVGEFAGIAADDLEYPNQFRAFHGHIIQDHGSINNEEARFRDLPIVRTLQPTEVADNYYRIRKDIDDLAEEELYRMKNTVGLAELIVMKISE